MKKRLSAVCVTTICAIGVAAAQSGSMEKGQMDKKGMMKDGAMMTVSGCVSAGAGSGQYMLTNAMMSSGMMDKEKMDKEMNKPDMAGMHMSYELVGGENLKAHMGHKVEVTGTMSQSDMGRMKKDTMGKTGSMDKMAGKDMKAMKLNVKSLKMISASCS